MHKGDKGLKFRLAIFLRGVAMGAADVVPGVSGGTIAFITGIYDQLIDSLKNCDLTALRLLFSAGPAEMWRHINGNFLLSLMLGICFSVLSLARGISWALETHPVPLSAFFFGLILASALLVYRQAPRSRLQPVYLLLGVALALLIAVVRPGEVPVTGLTVFAAGALAICAMILPGISGSFILLLLGMYEPVINAIKTLDLAMLAIFVAGCATGLLLFVRLLSYMLHHFRGPLLAWLTGVLLGSLAIIWPWKLGAAGGVASSDHNLDWHNVLPDHYGEYADPQLLLCFSVMAFGIVVVVSLEKIAEKFAAS